MTTLTAEEEQQLKQLSVQELLELRSAKSKLEKKLATERLLPLCRLYNPNFIEKDFNRQIAEHLEAVERGDLRFLMIFMPPRHGKSHETSENFPAFYAGRHPEQHIVICSYAEGLAQTFNRRARDRVMDKHRWPFPDVTVRPDLAGVEEWGTNKGGTCRAKGITGGITGRGANLFVMDDLVADREAANSQLQRDALWNWYQDTAHTRLEPGGAIVMPMTRWHDDDVAGRILNSPAAKDWTVLIFPAIAEPNVGSDIKGVGRIVTVERELGSALFPERYDIDELLRIKANMKSLSWNALYQQRPAPEEGNIFKRAWWNYWTPWMPAQPLDSKGRRMVKLPKKFVAVYFFVDSAFKTGVSNDYSTCALWGKDEEENYYLLQLWRLRLELPALLAKLKLSYQRHRFPQVIEDKASGQSAIQMLRSSKVRVVPGKYQGDHFQRAEAITQIVEGGKVFLPYTVDIDGTNVTQLIEDFIEEHAKFPTAAHDDQVDTTSMALLKLDKIKGRQKASQYVIGDPTERRGGKNWNPFDEYDDAVVKKEKRAREREEAARTAERIAGAAEEEDALRLALVTSTG